MGPYCAMKGRLDGDGRPRAQYSATRVAAKVPTRWYRRFAVLIHLSAHPWQGGASESFGVLNRRRAKQSLHSRDSIAGAAILSAQTRWPRYRGPTNMRRQRRHTVGCPIADSRDSIPLRAL